MNRRTLLATAAALIPVGILAACSGSTTTTPTVQQLAQDVNLLATGLAPVIAALPSAAASPATIAAAQAALATIQKDAAAIAASSTPSTSTVQEVISTVQTIAPMLIAVPGLAPFVPVIEAALALGPVVLSEAGINVAAAVPNKMDPTTARMLLRSSAATK